MYMHLRHWTTESVEILILQLRSRRLGISKSTIVVIAAQIILKSVVCFALLNVTSRIVSNVFCLK